MGFSQEPSDVAKLVYFWRCIGYLLGLPDEYNLCSEDMDQVRSLCTQLVKQNFGPSVLKQDPDSELMAKRIVTTSGQYIAFMYFNTIMKYILDALHIDHKVQLNNNAERFAYTSYEILLDNLVHYRPVRALFNAMLRLTIVVVQTKWVSQMIANNLQRKERLAQKTGMKKWN